MTNYTDQIEIKDIEALKKNDEQSVKFLISVYESYFIIDKYKYIFTQLENLLQALKKSSHFSILVNHVASSSITLYIRKYGDRKSLFRYLPSFHTLVIPEATSSNNNSSSTTDKPPILSHLVYLLILKQLYIDDEYSLKWKITELAIVSKQFFQICSNLLSHRSTPLEIYSNIPIGSQYCMLKNTPLHLESHQINFIPTHLHTLCYEQLISYTFYFTQTDSPPPPTIIMRNLKHIRFQDIYSYSKDIDIKSYNADTFKQIISCCPSLQSYDFITKSSLPQHFTFGVQCIKAIPPEIKSNHIHFKFSSDTFMDNVEMSDLEKVDTVTLDTINAHGSSLFKFENCRILKIEKIQSVFDLHLQYHTGEYYEKYSKFSELHLRIYDTNSVAQCLPAVKTKFHTLVLDFIQLPIDSKNYENHFDTVVNKVNGLFKYLSQPNFDSIKSIQIYHSHKFSTTNANNSTFRLPYFTESFMKSNQLQTHSFICKDLINFIKS